MLSILSDAHSLLKSRGMDPIHLGPGNAIAKNLYEDSHIDCLRERVRLRSSNKIYQASQTGRGLVTAVNWKKENDYRHVVLCVPH